MKYLKKYTEATVYISDSDIKDLIYDKLLDLDDLEAGFHYFIQNYLESDDANKLNVGEGTEFVKVNVMNESRFEYEQISDIIESLKVMMKMYGYNIWDYTCYLGHRPPTPKIERDLRRQYNRFGDGRWTEGCYTFSIKFVKGDNSKSTYMWMLGQDKSTNEELNPETYKSAADILSKKGHINKPAELMKGHDIVKKKLEDESKIKSLNNVKQLGIYQCNLSFGGSKFTGNFYLNLQFDDYTMKDDHLYFEDGESKFWMNFSVGVIPTDEESEKYCQEVLLKRIGLGRDKITYWICEFKLHLSDTHPINYIGSYEEEPDTNEEYEYGITTYFNRKSMKKFKIENSKWVPLYLDIDPKGKGYFECHDGDFYLVNRKSAIQFKSKLYDFFAGKIILDYRSNDDEKSIIIDTFCNELGHTIDEYELIMESIKKISINTLYRD